ncbi:transporter [Occallatibacter savannae]|uniref:transporter n=1 Tax=Occallatibacter savannae TaxID=1002691 RepID=UPI000D68A876|nr:transporter [Occallatibacter savannae]
MRPPLRHLLLAVLASVAAPLYAQMPFYTDNADVTDQGTLHFEIFNEYDGLQSAQYPNLRQNTANFKVNYGLPHALELDFDIPWLSIYRAPGSQTANGNGDADMGIKWNFYKAPRPLRAPSLSSSLYIEFPTGDDRQSLGSGLTDYALNSIAQEAISDKTRINGNFGFLFAGNTSTGVLGIQTTHGHVYTGGLSLTHDFSPRLTLGGELYGALDDNNGLGKDQLQALLGGAWALNRRTSVTFAILGGAHIASPRIGCQFGYEIDFPLRHPATIKSAFNEPTASPLRRTP